MNVRDESMMLVFKKEMPLGYKKLNHDDRIAACRKIWDALDDNTKKERFLMLSGEVFVQFYGDTKLIIGKKKLAAQNKEMFDYLDSKFPDLDRTTPDFFNMIEPGKTKPQLGLALGDRIGMSRVPTLYSNAAYGYQQWLMYRDGYYHDESAVWMWYFHHRPATIRDKVINKDNILPVRTYTDDEWKAELAKREAEAKARWLAKQPSVEDKIKRHEEAIFKLKHPPIKGVRHGPSREDKALIAKQRKERIKAIEALVAEVKSYKDVLWTE